MESAGGCVHNVHNNTVNLGQWGWYFPNECAQNIIVFCSQADGGRLSRRIQPGGNYKG